MKLTWHDCTRACSAVRPDPAAGYADDQFAMGLTHVQIATEFLASPEGQADFAGLTDNALISALAQGLLGRSFSASDQNALTTLLGQRHGARGSARRHR